MDTGTNVERACFVVEMFGGKLASFVWFVELCVNWLFEIISYRVELEG